MMYFNRYITISEFAPLATLLQESGRRVLFPKGARFVSQQGCSRLCGMVEEGAFRYLHLDDCGEEHVVGFAFENEFVGDYVSMRIDHPAYVTIEAMCDSRAVVLAHDDLETFFHADAGHERLGRRVAEHLMAELYERLLQRHTLSPQVRYEALLLRCPRLFEVVPLRDLASYLGVRPETLSRIRRRMVMR